MSITRGVLAQSHELEAHVKELSNIGIGILKCWVLKKKKKKNKKENK